jgi:hypothetical protein
MPNEIGPNETGAGDRRPSNSRADEQRRFEHGSGGAVADVAVEGRPKLQDQSEDAPCAREAPPLAPDAPYDQLGEKIAVVGDRTEAEVDEAVEESFPASDPPSPAAGRRPG